MSEQAASDSEKNLEFCRFCGHSDDLTFCSKCALPLERGITNPIEYIIERFSVAHELLFRFLRTLTVLTVRPYGFFEKLNNGKDGAANPDNSPRVTI